jgi:hypothetical protein
MSFVKEYGLPLAGAGVAGLGLFLLYKQRTGQGGKLKNLLATEPSRPVTVMTSSTGTPLNNQSHPLTASVLSATNYAQAQVATAPPQQSSPLPPPPPGPSPSQQIANQVTKANAVVHNLVATTGSAPKELYQAVSAAIKTQIASGDYVYVAQPGDITHAIAARFGVPNDTTLAVAQTSSAVDKNDPRRGIMLEMFEHRIAPGTRVIIPALSTDAGPSDGATGPLAVATPAEKAVRKTP